MRSMASEGDQNRFPSSHDEALNDGDQNCFPCSHHEASNVIRERTSALVQCIKASVCLNKEQ